MESYKEQPVEEISLEKGKRLREEIYKKAKELFPNSTFSGQLDPKTSSLTIFNEKNKMTKRSVVEVVKRCLERTDGDAIDKKDKGNIKEFENYLDLLI